MEEFLSLLHNTPLLQGIPPKALPSLLEQLGAVTRPVSKGDTLLRAGEPSSRVGILLEGALEASRPMPNGQLIPIARFAPGGVFGDVLGGSHLSSPVTVTAQEDGRVLLLPYAALLCPGDDPLRQRVLQNLVGSISDKYFQLSHRVELLVTKTLRSKVCAYLLGEAEASGGVIFTIPYSRTQLADYLNCDRSALSRELSLMQQEGLVDFYRNSFKLLNLEGLRRHL